MAIARSFREGWLTSQKIEALKNDSAELFLFRLGLKADKHGVYHAEPELIRAAVYPLQGSRRRLAEIARYLRLCAEAGLIRLYVAANGRPYAQILNWRQKTPNEQALHPRPPGDPDDTGQEHLSLDVSTNGMKEKEPPLPPAERGAVMLSPSSPKPRKRSPARMRISLTAELSAIEEELRSILRPGGCAYNVTPTGAKLDRYNQLIARLAEIRSTLASLPKEQAS